MVVGFVVGYLASGLLALGVFEMATGRIRHNAAQAVVETQLATLQVGKYGRIAAMVILGLFTWAFWPAVFAGAVLDKKNKEKRAEKSVEKAEAK